jgi:hypothetical protein
VVGFGRQRTRNVSVYQVQDHLEDEDHDDDHHDEDDQDHEKETKIKKDKLTAMARYTKICSSSTDKLGYKMTMPVAFSVFFRGRSKIQDCSCSGPPYCVT